jgi:MFS family permease
VVASAPVPSCHHQVRQTVGLKKPPNIPRSTWGFINSFGLFQTYCTTALKEPPSSISWIGSVQVFTPFFIGAFSGRATDAGFFKLTFAIGMIIQFLGIFMTSLCKTYWQVFLAHGVCVGIGNGLVFIPALTITSTYFLRNRSLAVGVAASGSSTGGLVYPAIAEQLLPKIGFGWTVPLMGVRHVNYYDICGRVLETSTTTKKRRATRRMDGVQGSAVWPICAFFISAVLRPLYGILLVRLSGLLV